MKFSATVSIIAAAGAYADLQVVKTVLSDVSSGIESLDTAAKGFGGDVGAVKSKADSLIATLKKGKSTVDGSSDLTLQDAIGLSEPVQGLTKKGQSLLDTFKAKRSDVEKAAACGTVRGELKDINDNSNALIKSVVGKVPKDAQTIAEGLAAGLTKVLAQAQDDFSEANCKDSKGSSSTGEPSMTASETDTETASETASETDTETDTETASATAPGTTMAPSMTVAPTGATGGNKTATTALPTMTAGASFMAPAGALVMAVVAALL
ncbi:hypothetical protein E4U13_007000 [Claviceps humidiphila]|uniref:Cell wall protein n=1 Tax=Claviceps humidiphila TaxID=1294629 RepID=A0A9P7Q950_9HYPO|nr:hypothetical protein E4U13_007000 [Claviceps humidiphila]